MPFATTSQGEKENSAPTRTDLTTLGWWRAARSYFDRGTGQSLFQRAFRAPQRTWLRQRPDFAAKTGAEDRTPIFSSPLSQAPEDTIPTIWIEDSTYRDRPRNPWPLIRQQAVDLYRVLRAEIDLSVGHRGHSKLHGWAGKIAIVGGLRTVPELSG
jgi:hypothetical protein